MLWGHSGDDDLLLAPVNAVRGIIRGLSFHGFELFVLALSFVCQVPFNVGTADPFPSSLFCTVLLTALKMESRSGRHRPMFILARGLFVEPTVVRHRFGPLSPSS